MGSIPFWGGSGDSSGDSAQEWNTIFLGEDVLPGSAQFTSVRKARGIDVQKSKGTDGATLKDEGFEPGRVSIEVTLWEPGHWDEWQRIRPKIDPQKAGGLRTPLDISAPETDEAGITQVYVQEIEQAPPRGGKKVYRLDCIQWFPEPKAAKTSTTPKSKGGATPAAEAPEPTVNVF